MVSLALYRQKRLKFTFIRSVVVSINVTQMCDLLKFVVGYYELHGDVVFGLDNIYTAYTRASDNFLALAKPSLPYSIHYQAVLLLGKVSSHDASHAATKHCSICFFVVVIFFFHSGRIFPQVFICRIRYGEARERPMVSEYIPTFSQWATIMFMHLMKSFYGQATNS